MADPVQINLDEVRAEVAKLTPEQKEEMLLKYRKRQKVQQAKHGGSDKQKAYQAKQREKMKLLKAEAVKAGLWEKIESQADQLAEEELAKETPETDVEEEEEATASRR